MYWFIMTYNMRALFKFVIPILSILMACGTSGNNYENLDLMSHGMPIKIKPPKGAIVEFDDLGIMKDLTVNGEGNYSLQIFSSETQSLDVAKLKNELKSEIESSAFFSKIISESPNGFIYEKKIDEDFINYDFRKIKIQGDTKYVYQAGMGGKYTEEDISQIFNSVE